MGTFFSGGTIWCSFGKRAQSIRVDNGKIVAINGSSASGDEVVDLKGAFLSPAFMDGHAHPLFAGREAQGPLVNGLQSVAEVVAEVKRFADENPDVQWIIGGAYEAAIVERGDFLASWLDEAVNNRPVILQAVDHHTIWVNSKALEIAGINVDTPDPEGGSIARNDDGSPRGTLREPSAMALIMKNAPARTIEADISAIKWACQKYLEAGVTAATDAWVEDGMAEAYIATAKAGELAIDMSIFLLAQPETWREKVGYFSKIRSEVQALGRNSRLSLRTIKFLGDGAFSSGTAALLEPYLDDPTSSGLLIWQDAEMLEAAQLFDLERYQLHIHAIGDAAVRQALDVIEKVQELNPAWDRRPVIVHAQLIDEVDLPRFAALGVIANYQPLWMYLDSMNKDLILPRLGQARNNRQYPLASMVKSGARISYGSDWPVTTYRPLEALSIPTLRRSPATSPDQAWSPQESVSIEESLTFYTEGVAYQSFDEERFGRIEVGMDADLLILGSNPFDVKAEDVAKIEILHLYKSGTLIFSQSPRSLI